MSGWTEVEVRVGDDPDFHWRVFPDPDGLGNVCVDLMTRNDSTGAFEAAGTLTEIPAHLVPRLCKAMQLVAQHMEGEA